MKAVLVIDMPDDVSLDEWYAVEVVVDRLKATEEELMQGIPFDESKVFKFIPLRPLPQKKVGDDLYEQYGRWTSRIEREVSYRLGFNDCLEEILGDTE